MRLTNIFEAQCVVEKFLKNNGEDKIYASNQSCSCKKEVYEKFEKLYEELKEELKKLAEKLGCKSYELWKELDELNRESCKELCEKICKNEELRKILSEELGDNDIDEENCEGLVNQLCEDLFKELEGLNDESHQREVFAVYVNKTNQFIHISKVRFDGLLSNKSKINKLLNNSKLLRIFDKLLNGKLIEFLKALQECPNIFKVTENGFWIAPFDSFTKAHSFAELLANVIYLTTHEKMRVSTGSGINHNPYKIF